MGAANEFGKYPILPADEPLISHLATLLWMERQRPNDHD